MDFPAETLSPLAAEIWSSMLGIDLDPIDGAKPDFDHQKTMTGCVQVSGDWSGAITVRCPSETARSFAAVMFGCEPDDLPIEEVRDALGELTNMTGGSIKGLVPGSCQLSIPTVTEGIEYSFSIPRSNEVCSVGFEYEGEPLEVVVYEVAK